MEQPTEFARYLASFLKEREECFTYFDRYGDIQAWVDEEEISKLIQEFLDERK